MTARPSPSKHKRSGTRRERKPRRETVHDGHARMTGSTSAVAWARPRLVRLYEISKLLARFDTVDRTVPRILAVLSEAIPLRVAVLILDGEGPSPRTRSIVWHAEGVSEARMRAARARAHEGYGYIVRPTRQSPIVEETGRGTLPRVSTSPLPPDVGAEAGFVVLPLVVDHRRIFGALHVEATGRLDEAALAFLNAVVNQLAIALDRIAVVLARHALAKRATLDAERGERIQRLLSETSRLLAGSLDYQTTLASVTRAVVPFLADLCYIDQVGEDGQIRRDPIVFGDPSKEHLSERLRQFAPRPG